MITKKVLVLFLAFFLLMPLALSYTPRAFLTYGHSSFFNESADCGAGAMCQSWTGSESRSTAQQANGSASMTVTNNVFSGVDSGSASANYNFTFRIYIEDATPDDGAVYMGLRNGGGICHGDGQGVGVGMNPGTSATNWAICAQGTWTATSKAISTTGWHPVEIRVYGTNYEVYIDGESVNNGTGSSIGDSIMAFDSDTTVTVYFDDMHVWNSTINVSAPTTTTPTFVSPTPASNQINNTQKIFNASSPDADTYYLWLDTNANPTTLVLNNITTGNYTSNFVSDDTYYYKAQAWSASGGYSANTSTRNYTFDATRPTITIGARNAFLSDNSTPNPLINSVPINISFGDNRDLFSYLINISKAGTEYFTPNSTSLSGTSFTYNNTFNFSGLPLGAYLVEVIVSDSHTDTIIKNYYPVVKDSEIKYFTGTDEITIRTAETSTFTTIKESDRYSFEITYADKTTKQRTLYVESKNCPLFIVENSEFKGHIVEQCLGGGGNWIDFEGSGGGALLNQLDEKTIAVTLSDVAPITQFNSVGALNTREEHYTFYNGVILRKISDIPPVTMDFDETQRYALNTFYGNYTTVSFRMVDTLDLEQIALNATYGGSEVTYVKNHLIVTLTPGATTMNLTFKSGAVALNEQFSSVGYMTVSNDNYAGTVTNNFNFFIQPSTAKSFTNFTVNSSNTSMIIALLVLLFVLFLFGYVTGAPYFVTFAGWFTVLIGVMLITTSYPLLISILITVFGFFMVFAVRD